MPTGQPTPIPFPLSTAPGANPQEGAGRLINCYAEPLGEAGKGAIADAVWRRSPGLSLFGRSSNSGYRGGLASGGISYETWGNFAATVDSAGNFTTLGTLPGTSPVSMAHNQVTPTPDVVAVDPNSGAFILNTHALANASATATIGGTTLTTGDSITLLFFNPMLSPFNTSVSYTLGGGATLTTIATGLAAAINSNAVLSGNTVTASSSGAVVTISQPGTVANQTFMQWQKTGTGNETITFSPASGFLTGGQGTAGITWTGTPIAYNGVNVMPQPNSICFQDGYFFFSTGGGQVYATDINSLTMNGLSFATIGSRSDVALLRVIAYSGLLFAFTTASCEIWQDTAQPPPGFPYSRSVVLDVGLIQASAIAGYETGFAELLWVAQDYGVHYMPQSSLAPPPKVSPPDLDRLIEAQVKAGATLEAGCYIFAGHKFWTLSSPAWTWEFNINTQKWNERWSLLPSGIYGRWRAKFGHPVFGKFIFGDAQSGNLIFVDDQNYTEIGVPQLFRIESGPVAAFPEQLRIARADFLFDLGVGMVAQQFSMTVTGTALGTGGVVRLTVKDSSQAQTGHTVIVSGVGGTTEANGTWTMTLIDASHIELVGSKYANTYTAGGSAVDLSSTPQQVAPVCAVSWSLDGGVNFGNPLLRGLGAQGHSKRPRVSVKNCGLSSSLGNRWRLDVTDAVYTGLMGGTQSSDPRAVGA